MGAVLSAPVNYVKTKVNNAKQSVVNKVTSVRDGIVGKVTDTRDGIVNRVTYVKRTVSTKVYNTVNSVCRKIVDTKDGVVNRVQRGCDAVVTKVNNTKAAIIAAKNVTVTTYQGAVNSVCTKYRNTRNSITDRYTNTKNTVYEQYRYYRNRKYTRWEKVKYSALGILILLVAIVTGLCLWDVYRGDSDQAVQRLELIWDKTQTFVFWVWSTVCTILQHLWSALLVILQYTWEGIKIVSFYVWEYSKLALYYVWIALKVAAHYVYHYSAIAAEKTAQGARVAGLFTWDCLKVAAHYVWIAMKVIAYYIAVGSKTAGEHAVTGVKVAAAYSYEGSVVAAEYSVAGFKYSLHHGWLLTQKLVVKTLQWTWYFLTNFRAASYDSSLYLWQTTKWLVANLWLGSKEGSYLAVEGSKYLANSTYHGTIYSARYTAAALSTTYHYTVWAGVETITAIKYTANVTWHFTKATVTMTCWAVTTGTKNVTNLTVSTAMTLYDTLRLVLTHTYAFLIDMYHFVTTWSYKVTMATWELLKVGFREYLFRWAYEAAIFLAEWFCIIGRILWKFVRDLNVVLVNVIVAVCKTLYNIAYVVFAFVYQIVSTVTLIVKSVIKGLVYCVTSVFTAIIWGLEHVFSAYSFALYKYNMYREFLFVGVLFIVVAYCSGLMQDRAQAGVDSDVSEDEEDTEWIQDVSAQKTTTRRRHKQQLHKIQEVDSEADTKPPPQYVARSTIPHYTDELLSDDSDADFDLGHDVPDFMHLSDSDPEPPTPDTTPDTDDDLDTPNDLEDTEGETEATEDCHELLSGGDSHLTLAGTKPEICDLAAKGHIVDLGGDHQGQETENSDLEVSDLKDSGVETS